MNLNFVAEVWDALRTHIDFNDRSDAADTLINLLIDIGTSEVISHNEISVISSAVITPRCAKVEGSHHS